MDFRILFLFAKFYGKNILLALTTNSFMKGVVILVLIPLALGIFYISISTNNHTFFKNSFLDTASSPTIFLKDNSTIAEKYAEKVKPFLHKNNYNTKYFFLVNMKIASGKKRFFVIDLLHDSIVEKGLVTHGSGSHCINDSLRFSNTPNSLATSLGKYKIGQEYEGEFGIAFKLHGLEPSNSNALNRFIVLHAHNCVPYLEIYPSIICESWGCPTVNPNFLQTLKKYIDNSDKPIVLWTVYE